jgi:hypothetical protein
MAPARVYAVFGLDGYAREIAAPRWGRSRVAASALLPRFCVGDMCEFERHRGLQNTGKVRRLVAPAIRLSG